MDPLRLLIVSYYFPPAAGGGVQRVLSWCRHLPEHNIEVHVLTPRDPRWLQSGGGLDVPEATVVHRTDNRSPDSVRPAQLLAETRGLQRLARRAQLLPRRLLLPDIHRPWMRDAVPAGIRAGRRIGFDAVLSTSPPETCHLVGQRIANELNIPWIADLRDSWLDLPHLRLDRASVRLKHRVNTRIANRTIARADRLVSVSEPIVGEQVRRWPQLAGRTQVIANGVEFDAISATTPRRLDEDADRTLLLYTGNFFGRQSPTSLLTAIESLSEQHAQSLRVRFVGSLPAADRARIDASPQLSDVVRIDEFRDHSEILALQHGADMLYLYIAPGRGSAGVLTGKLFEYLASPTTILAAVPEEGAAAAYLREANA